MRTFSGDSRYIASDKYKPRNKTRKYRGRGDELRTIFSQFQDGTNGDCFEQLAAETVEMDAVYRRWHAWTHWYEDMGLRDLCNSLPDSRYLFVYFNITDIPHLFPVGTCVPTSCAANTSFATSVIDVANKYLAAVVREAKVIYDWDQLVLQVDPNDKNQNYWKYFASVLDSRSELALSLAPQEEEVKPRLVAKTQWMYAAVALPLLVFLTVLLAVSLVVTCLVQRAKRRLEKLADLKKAKSKKSGPKVQVAINYSLDQSSDYIVSDIDRSISLDADDDLADQSFQEYEDGNPQADTNELVEKQHKSPEAEKTEQ